MKEVDESTGPVKVIGLIISICLSVLGLLTCVGGLLWPNLGAESVYGGYFVVCVGSLLTVVHLRCYRGPGFGSFVWAWVIGSLLISLATCIYTVLMPVPLLTTIPFHLTIMALFIRPSRTRGRFEAGLLPIISAVGAFVLPPLLCLDITTPYPAEPTEILVQADHLSSKTPAFIDKEALWEREKGQGMYFGGYILETNKSAAVISMDEAEIESQEKSAVQGLFPTYAEAIAHAKSRRLSLVPSVQLVDHKAKCVGEDLLTSLEEYMHGDLGTGDLASATGLIPRFLSDLRSALMKTADLDSDLGRDGQQGLAHVNAALLIGGSRLEDLRAEDEQRARSLIVDFMDDGQRSKPIGIYAQTPSLRKAFQQDRFLQKDLDRSIASVLAQVMAKQPALRKRYGRILKVYARFTNRAAALSLEDLVVSPDLLEKNGSREAIQILPHATSIETELFNKLYRSQAQLPEHSIMNRLIAAIRAGDLDLRPKESSGWYDYQIYALENLLRPESGQEGEKLLLSVSYKKRLIEAFRSMLTKKRELHVKRLQLGIVGGATGDFGVRISPDIRVEPMATYYLRTARGLRFVTNALTGTLQEAEQAPGFLKQDSKLMDRIQGFVDLCYGLYLVVCRDLGMEPRFMKSELDEVAILRARAKAEAWLKAFRDDPDMKVDGRCIVHVVTHLDRTQSRYWMVTGVRLIKVRAEYVRFPAVRIVKEDTGEVAGEVPPDSKEGLTSGKFKAPFKYVPKEWFMPVEVFLEGSGPPVPPERRQFRELCNREGTNEGISAGVRSGAW